MLDLESFVSKYVIKRDQSLFLKDLESNYESLRKRIEGKEALVIGGAGSIGSSFIRELLRFSPQSLVVVDTDENGLAELTRDLRSTYGITLPAGYLTYPMDYRSDEFEKMFRAHRGFDIVANFSAHKHVRSEKDIYSIEALLKNNVLCARILLELMVEFPPEEYFCVSTDKAANPVNIMGASKRIMEDLIFSYSRYYPVKTARFANVAFSNGSLPCGFLNRIAKRQPLSAPTDVKRYFVSMEESGQICLLSCFLANNREILFPKLKEVQMTGFDQIAWDLLSEYGYTPIRCDSEESAKKLSVNLKKGSREYPVYFSGSDTSGEKPYEEFYTEKETVDTDRFDALGVIVDKEMPDRERLSGFLDSLEKSLAGGNANKDEVVRMISGYLLAFHHIETGKSLDEKM